MLASSSYARNRHRDIDYIAIAIDVHSAFLLADIHRDVFAELLDEAELASDEIEKLEEALYGYWKAPILASRCCNCLGRHERPYSSDRPQWLQN